MTIRDGFELAGLRSAGAVVHETLRVLQEAVAAGMTTQDLDALAREVFDRYGARSAPQLVYQFPGTICISVNDEIVHGIPGPRRLRPGDVLKLDVTVELDGFIADAARTVLVAPDAADPQALGADSTALIRCAEEAFAAAVEELRPGVRVCDIGGAVERVVRDRGFAVVRELTGHGVGRTIHEEPSMPNYFHPGHNRRLEEGMVLAIEPILGAGSGEAYLASDGWTVKTADGRPAAHYENTVVVRDRGVEILTLAA